MEQKNISFGYGIRRSPTLGNDGELSECVNLIPENGELVNIRPTTPTGIKLTSNERLMYIHKTDKFTHYIVSSVAKGKCVITFSYFTSGNTTTYSIYANRSLTSDIKVIFETGWKSGDVVTIIEEEETLSMGSVGSIVSNKTFSGFLGGVRLSISEDDSYVYDLAIRNYTTHEGDKDEPIDGDEETEEPGEGGGSGTTVPIIPVPDTTLTVHSIFSGPYNIIQIGWDSQITEELKCKVSYYDKLSGEETYAEVTITPTSSIPEQIFLGKGVYAKIKSFTVERVNTDIINVAKYNCVIASGSEYVPGVDDYVEPPTEEEEEEPTPTPPTEEEDTPSNPPTPSIVHTVTVELENGMLTAYIDIPFPTSFTCSVDLQDLDNGDIVTEDLEFGTGEDIVKAKVRGTYQLMGAGCWYNSYVDGHSLYCVTINNNMRSMRMMARTVPGSTETTDSLVWIDHDNPNKRNYLADIAVNDISSTGNAIVISNDDGMTYLMWDAESNSYRILGAKPEMEIQFALKGELVQSRGKAKIVETIGKSDSYQNSFDKFVQSAHFRKSDENNAYERAFEVSLPQSLPSGKEYKFCVDNAPFARMNVGLYGVWMSGGKKKYDEIGTFKDFYIKKTDHTFVGLWISLAFEGYAAMSNWEGAEVAISVWESSEETTEETNGYGIENTEASFNEVMGYAEEFINYQKKSRSKFVEPFFIRYALKMFDGSYILHSAPILMIPNSGCAPLAYMSDGIAQPGDYTVIMSANACDIQYKILSDISALDDWKDIITDVVISVTDPIYTFKQGELFDERKNQLPLCKMNVSNFSNDMYSSIQGRREYGVWRMYDLLKERDTSVGSTAYVVDLPKYSDGEITESITNKGTFYIIKEIPIKDLKKSDGWITIDLEGKQLNALTSYPRLNDDFNTHNTLAPKTTFSYNNRLNIANITEWLYKGFPVALMDGFTGGDKKFWQEVSLTYDMNTPKVRIKSEAVNDPNITWFYYPNTNAKRVKLWYADGTKMYKAEISLTKHQFLNGAYWYDANGVQWQEDNYFKWAGETTESVTHGNYIYQSVVNNPFAYDVMNMTSVGMGEIYAISAATKALSSGSEFGSSPLLCFCSDGIYPLISAADGTYTAVKPLSRDVVTNVGAITQIDDAVLYITKQGLKVTNGSETGTELLSERIHGKNYDESRLIGLLESHNSLIIPDTDDFIRVLQSCRMLYDDVYKLVHIYPSNIVGKHYVLSLKSGEFSSYAGPDAMVKAIVPGYPLSTVQLSDNRLAVYDNIIYDGSKRKGVLLTRAMAIDSPTAMKILCDLKMSYTKNDAATKCYIQPYVSNDRRSWFQMKSLRAHSFKWYRFAIFTNMTDHDALEGLSLVYDLRRVNKIR